MKNDDRISEDYPLQIFFVNEYGRERVTDLYEFEEQGIRSWEDIGGFEIYAHGKLVYANNGGQ